MIRFVNVKKAKKCQQCSYNDAEDIKCLCGKNYCKNCVLTFISKLHPHKKIDNEIKTLFCCAWCCKHTELNYHNYGGDSEYHKIKV